MGFLDKAKKMAEQAQAKLDEVQTQFNEGQGGGAAGSGPAVEYDKHGRPIPQHPPATATPPQGDPLAGTSTPPPPASPSPVPGVPPTGQGDPLGAAAAAPAPPPPAAEPPVAAPGVPPTADTAPPVPPAPVAPAAEPAAPAPSADSAKPGNAGVPEDRNKANYEPPKLSSGDPLAG
jgi:hypothetical protein